MRVTTFSDPNLLQKQRIKGELMEAIRGRAVEDINGGEAVRRESNPSPAPFTADIKVEVQSAVYSRQNSISSRLEDNSTPTGTDLLQIQDDHSAEVNFDKITKLKEENKALGEKLKELEQKVEMAMNEVKNIAIRSVT